MSNEAEFSDVYLICPEGQYTMYFTTEPTKAPVGEQLLTPFIVSKEHAVLFELWMNLIITGSPDLFKHISAVVELISNNNIIYRQILPNEVEYNYNLKELAVRLLHKEKVLPDYLTELAEELRKVQLP